MPIDVLKVVLSAVVAFLVGIALTPRLTYFLYSRKMWKKVAGKMASTGEVAAVFNSLHSGNEVRTPRLGGIIVWASTLGTALLFWLLARFSDVPIFDKIEFISRDQTWIPLCILAAGALIGLIDDLLEIRGRADGSYSRGLSLSFRLTFVAALGLGAAVWFVSKLDASSIGLPFFGSVDLGMGGYILAFVGVMVALYAGGVIDGIDGLSGGVFAIIYTAYAALAFFQDQINVAALCATIAGATLAFLWFNIPPARFYLSETGSMPLTITLATVAFMTDSFGEGKGIAVLPIIALPLLGTMASSLLQVASKKLRHGKKIFKVAPLHHHFEAIGWPREKVVMRYWIITVALALIGLIVALIDTHA